jgi:hypothetical protein
MSIDLGGYVMEYAQIAEHWHKPIAGVCASACTMKLLSATCVDGDAFLLFHPATSSLATIFMAGYYKPKLRQWFMSGFGDRWVRGKFLQQFGYELCDAKGGT